MQGNRPNKGQFLFHIWMFSATYFSTYQLESEKMRINGDLLPNALASFGRTRLDLSQSNYSRTSQPGFTTTTFFSILFYGAYE